MPALRALHPDPAIPILNVGPVHDKADEKTDRIGDDVALAPLDPFSVRAAYAAPLGAGGGHGPPSP